MSTTLHLRPLESIASKKRSPFMTLIVAAKSKDSVVIAADSQISFDHSSLRTDVKKIERVDFTNLSVVVALADNVRNARRFITIFREMGAHSTPSSPDDVGMIAQRAMEQLRTEEARTYVEECRNKDFKTIIHEHALNCSMMIGFCFDSVPHIILTSLLTPSYDLSTAEYEADGCGATLAHFILREYFVPRRDTDYTALMTVYAVWSVIENDRYCEGPIVVWLACPPGGLNSGRKSRVIEFSPERIKDLIAIAEEIHAMTKKTRVKVTNEQFALRAEAYFKWLEEEIASIPPQTEQELKIQWEEREYDRKRDSDDFS